ncbi:hypothetical protein EV700_1625 [Fluviicoccus keumensis]|uniref:Uncharacterized protein n=1 Tax=Fluviicoccus keumensis TaxID=1435465 RepID=A0A4Q7Z9N2_9GAMM|nr:hypothetical protein [Fluviicoccus keumensis]RZU47230.1 hypothetical protein EV700_1625 [Fluviicoccus keumensis]
MLQSTAVFQELLMFWDGEDIAKSMLYEDFDVTLSGMVPQAQYAREEKKGAYIQIDDSLTIKGCVLFTIRFDRQGFAEAGWNIPLSHLVEVAGLGPDMGRGPIRLACRSQCPVSWHAPRLWDPVLRDDLNTFEQIREALPSACERFGIRARRPALTETNIPVLSTADLVPQPWESDLPHLPAETEALQQQVSDLLLKLQTLTTEREQTVNEQAYVHQQQLDILQTQNQKLVEQQRTLKTQLDAQLERMEALHSQIISLSGIESSLKSERTENERKLKELQAALSKAGEAQQQVAVLLEAKEQEFASRLSRRETELVLAMDRRLDDEANRHLLTVKSLQAELEERDHQLAELEKSLEAERAEQARIAESSADSYLRELQGMGMSFVVYHPGVGNLSVPVDDLASYTRNPPAYVARKCLVSEEHYREWIRHFENPRCLASIGEGACCNARLIRVDSPAKFVSGQSDRCARHQGADTAILNVLKFQ